MLFKKSIKSLALALSLALASSTALVGIPQTALAANTNSKLSPKVLMADAVKTAQSKVKGVLLEVELDYNNGKLYYEINILDALNNEHELDINASTGKIVKQTKKRLNKTKAARLRKAKISHDDAINIAKKETTGTIFISSKLDYTDDYSRGTLIYEVKLIDDANITYEIDIDATTGKVLHTEEDYDD